MDCLVVKLKKNINNDKLPILGKLHYKINSGESFLFQVGGTGAFVTVENGHLETAGGTAVATPYTPGDSLNTRAFVADSNNAKIVINQKSLLTYISFPCNLTEIASCDNLVQIGFNQSLLFGDIASLKGMPNLEVFNVESSSVTELLHGDIKVFGSCPKFKKLDIRRNIGIYGDIEGIIVGLIGLNRTSAVKGTGLEMISLSSDRVDVRFRKAHFGYANGYFTWSPTENAGQYNIQYYNTSDTKLAEETIEIDSDGTWEIVTN